MKSVTHGRLLADADVRLPGSAGARSLQVDLSDVSRKDSLPAYHEPASHAVVKWEPTPDMLDQGVLEAVVPPIDTRRPVTNTRVYPFSAICALRMVTESGLTFAGTGFLIGPRLVLTAGHNVYAHDVGGFMHRVYVYPGLNKDINAPPFPFVQASRFLTLEGWVRDANPELDVGAIALSTPVGKQAGWFAVSKLTRGTLSGLAVTCAGYPRDCPKEDANLCGPPATSMWFDSSNLIRVEPNRLLYSLVTSIGCSGAPVFAHFPDKSDPYHVVGVHNMGFAAYNAASRISDAVFSKIVHWKRSIEN